MKKMFFNSVSFFAAVVAVCVLLPLSVYAKGKDMKQIPNGKKFQCAQCHSNGNYKPEGYTAFGKDYQVNGRLWNALLAKKDSDGDGKTNGQELGNPDGSWKKGDTDPSGPVTNPGDAANR